METENFYKTKRSIIIINILVFIVMLIISTIAFPHLWEKFDCAADIGKLTCKEATNVKYFGLLFLPLFQLVFTLFIAFFPANKKEKIAMSPNSKRIKKIYYSLAIFAIFAHPVTLSFLLMTREMFNKHADNILAGFTILFSLFIFYAANMSAKMSKSWLSGWATPWNLKSELAWEKSQRFAGFAMTGVAIILFISTIAWRFFYLPFFLADFSVIIIIGGGILTYAGVFIISYYVYQQEQHNKAKEENNL